MVIQALYSSVSILLSDFSQCFNSRLGIPSEPGTLSFESLRMVFFTSDSSMFHAINSISLGYLLSSISSRLAWFGGGKKCIAIALALSFSWAYTFPVASRMSKI